MGAATFAAIHHLHSVQAQLSIHAPAEDEGTLVSKGFPLDQDMIDDLTAELNEALASVAVTQSDVELWDEGSPMRAENLRALAIEQTNALNVAKLLIRQLSGGKVAV